MKPVRLDLVFLTCERGEDIFTLCGINHSTDIAVPKRATSGYNGPRTNTKQPVKIQTEFNGSWQRLTRILLNHSVDQEDTEVFSKRRDISSSHPETIPELEGCI